MFGFRPRHLVNMTGPGMAPGPDSRVAENLLIPHPGTDKVRDAPYFPGRIGAAEIDCFISLLATPLLLSITRSR